MLGSSLLPFHPIKQMQHGAYRANWFDLVFLPIYYEVHAPFVACGAVRLHDLFGYKAHPMRTRGVAGLGNFVSDESAYSFVRPGVLPSFHLILLLPLP